MKKISVLVGLCMILAACSADKSFSPDEEELQQAKHVTLFESKDSHHKWILNADEVDFEDMANAVLTNPHLMLYENNQPSAEISGKRGTLNYAQKLVSIEGDAVVHSLAEQVRLTTDRFFYDIDKDRVWSDKKTLVTRNNAKITAKAGIETDSKLRKIEFKKQTTQLPTDLAEIKGAIK